MQILRTLTEPPDVVGDSQGHVGPGAPAQVAFHGLVSCRDYCCSRVSQGDAAGKDTTHDNGFPSLSSQKESVLFPSYLRLWRWGWAGTQAEQVQGK